MTSVSTKIIGLAAALALSGCNANGLNTASRSEPVDPATGLVACPTYGGVLPSRGGEGVRQSPSSLPEGFKDGTQGCIAANNANAALHQGGQVAASP
jgi:hypothetical protein